MKCRNILCKYQKSLIFVKKYQNINYRTRQFKRLQITFRLGLQAAGGIVNKSGKNHNN